LMVLTTMIPLGSLLIGAVSHYIGVETTIFVEGCIALIAAVFYGRYLKKEKLKKVEESLVQIQEAGVL